MLSPGLLPNRKLIFRSAIPAWPDANVTLKKPGMRARTAGKFETGNPVLLDLSRLFPAVRAELVPPIQLACVCYAGLGPGMHPRNFVFITLCALCHLQLGGQVLTNALRAPAYETAGTKVADREGATAQLPDDPGQEIMPIAQPQSAPSSGVPVRWEAGRQTRVGDTWTLSGGVVVHYRDYILRADKVVYHQSTTELEADGHLQVEGGPDDVVINASNGDMRLDLHTARFFNVDGSLGVRRSGRTVVYSTPNPFLFSGRVLLQTGEGSYRIIGGTMTNCRLPRPDWLLIAHSIKVANGRASTTNTFLKLLGVPVFYLPYLRHPVEENGRESGLLIPIISNSSIKGLSVREQVYLVLNRSMDLVIGSEYYSKRGFAPNGDFRYKGRGLDFVTASWNALLDRGVAATPPATGRVNQGGTDVVALGRQDITPNTHVAANVEYLSSYLYKLVFNDNYSQAVSSEVQSTLSLTNVHNGFIPSAYLGRLQTFASSTSGDEARILHLPSLRFDSLDSRLGSTPLYWGLGSSIGRLSRAELDFNARNVGRIDIYPRISLPIVAGGWSLVPELAVRDTTYSGSQNPDLTGANGGTPYLSHEALHRSDFEFSVDLRPPTIEKDFTLKHWNRQLRHVVEPEFTYKYVDGIGAQARNVLLVDTSDIATNTNEVGYSLTQRFYLRPLNQLPCTDLDAGSSTTVCPAPAREWASWQIAQKFFIDPNFGGAIIPNRRNVFDSTLDLSGVAFLTVPRNLSPITSRLRFEAIDNLRIEWDMDYDPRGGRLGADNLYAGYSWGRTTVGLGHALLNAVDEQGSRASTIQSQQLAPFSADRQAKRSRL